MSYTIAGLTYTKSPRAEKKPKDKWGILALRPGYEVFHKGACCKTVYGAWYHYKSCACPKAPCKGWVLHIEQSMARGGVIIRRIK